MYVLIVTTTYYVCSHVLRMFTGSNFIPEHLKKFEFPWTPTQESSATGNKVTFTVLEGTFTVLHACQ